ARNFSPARKVRSITAPSEARRSLERTNAPPLPGLTCWNSRILKTVPSTSMWFPFLNWFVLIMGFGVRVLRRAADRFRLLSPPRVADTWPMGDLAASATPIPTRGLPLRLLGDERLARLTAAGSDRAFAVLYERHHQA